MYIVVVGVGKVGYFLAKRLYLGKHSISVVDADKFTCEEIAKELEILVINGDGCDPNILEEAGVERADVLAAVTGSDEDNLIICQIAKERFNVRRTLARVNNPDNERTFSELGVDVPVDSTKIIAKIIEEEVSFSDFVNLMSFKRGKLTIVRVDLPSDSPVINKELKDLQLPADSVLVSIVRGEEVIVPKGNTMFKPGDDIIALTLIGNESQLLNLLLGKL
ncbi:MAG: NAD-binding protein [Candidatus Omnitrophota bacterium]|nr:NAD-binding protein [Candidatus Omnitrophota bacterium]MBU1929000.1 NAD-binding protein [Candidatus Omnitrophota bacterium]MBU2035685.1 NAD-binding protein [Candidatus Omnitrophota bacterium]MBU2221880.1 NAD-binding protein [Candidatus Omnitrophota bacterium]MBU2258849.1 NAD-binding protein [Candidatus Omnitrophota bacterium]